MVFTVSQKAVDEAIAEQEGYLCEVAENAVFLDDGAAEIVCAVEHLEACGMHKLQLHSMTIADILEEYHLSLQEDAS